MNNAQLGRLVQIVERQAPGVEETPRGLRLSWGEDLYLDVRSETPSPPPTPPAGHNAETYAASVEDDEWWMANDEYALELHGPAVPENQGLDAALVERLERLMNRIIDYALLRMAELHDSDWDDESGRGASAGQVAVLPHCSYALWRLALSASGGAGTEGGDDAGRTRRAYNQCCAVCCQRFHYRSRVTALACGHLYHRDCIGTWLRQSCCCPLCKRAVDCATLPPAPAPPLRQSRRLQCSTAPEGAK